MKYRNLLACIAISGGLLIGCDGGNKGDSALDTPKKDNNLKADSVKSTLFQVGDEIFSIPSPIQSAAMLKNQGANFDIELLNSPNKAPSYSTKFQQAVNLGVYGADLGYVTIYEQTQNALSYLNSTKKIADKLGVSGAFSPELIERFELNMGDKDSMLVLVSEAYRASDSYLKNSERNDVGGLILAGGWIEALYYTSQASKDLNNQSLKNRIGEQKSSLENLIKLLQKYASQNGEVADFVEELIDLYYMFDEVEITYTFVKPSTDPDVKTTTINSTSEIVITDEQITIITDMIAQIRNNIIS